MKIFILVLPLLFCITNGKSFKSEDIDLPCFLANPPAASVVNPSNVETGHLVVNIYSKNGQQPVVNNPSSGISGAYQAIKDRFKIIQTSLPSMPSMPSMPALPPFRIPSLPSIPQRVKVPVRVHVQTHTVTFPPPRPLPTLPPLPTIPPIKVPNRVIVGQMEVVRPTLPPPPKMPTIKPLEVVYQDIKPIAPKPGNVLPSLPSLTPVTGPCDPRPVRPAAAMNLPFTVILPPCSPSKPIPVVLKP